MAANKILPFHGEATISSGTVGTFTVIGASSSSAITLTNGDRLVITDIRASTDTAGVLSIFEGTNATVDAGDCLASLYVAANGGYAVPFQQPYECIAVASGFQLRLGLSNSGNAKGQVNGYVIQNT